eukprot:gb/GFBE01038777.1/.p1 GENE.gb/GFBE01038777.1/~~gb/GFBE01038777.1/.p1  ORF type:complete len:503 (+),score=107.26 gb/GFBE01038777.1/:1-1509(+)
MIEQGTPREEQATMRQVTGSPTNMKVKNTFIEFDEEFDDDVDGLAGAFSRRQVSEPSPCTRAMFAAFPERLEKLPLPSIQDSPKDTGCSTDRSTDSAVATVGDKGYETDETFEIPMEQQRSWASVSVSKSLSQRTEDDAIAWAEPIWPQASDVSSNKLCKKERRETQKPAKSAVSQSRELIETAEAPKHIPGWEEVYTVMMRNLPNKYTQKLLVEEIHLAGFKDTYDFLYLPMDHQTGANRGYAFINFITPLMAQKFKQRYEGVSMKSFNSTKIVNVNPAALQGFLANYEHYSTARVNRAAPGCRPIFLREPSYEDESASNQRRIRRGRLGSSGSAVSAIDVAVQKQKKQAPQPKSRPSQRERYQVDEKQQQEQTSSQQFGEVTHQALGSGVGGLGGQSPNQQSCHPMQQTTAQWQKHDSTDAQGWCVPLPGMQVPHCAQVPGSVNYCSMCGLVAEAGMQGFCRACGGSLYGREPALMATSPTGPTTGSYGYPIAGASPSYY